jgi:hypothetical protein
MSLIWLVVIAALVMAAYLALGGRALFPAQERADRILGERVQLANLESGPKGLDPAQPALPPAVVERFDGVLYVLSFERPFEWLGKTETYATVASRSKGYPLSRATRRRTVAVNGKFGSGEGFIGMLRRL